MQFALGHQIISNLQHIDQMHNFFLEFSAKYK